MIVVWLLLLLIIAAGLIGSGWIVLLFPVGWGILKLAGMDKNNEAADFFFALCFFGGIAAVGLRVLGVA